MHARNGRIVYLILATRENCGINRICARLPVEFNWHPRRFTRSALDAHVPVYYLRQLLPLQFPLKCNKWTAIQIIYSILKSKSGHIVDIARWKWSIFLYRVFLCLFYKCHFFFYLLSFGCCSRICWALNCSEACSANNWTTIFSGSIECTQKFWRRTKRNFFRLQINKWFA